MTQYDQILCNALESLDPFRIPVMRLVGSKTSIFSSKSKAPGDILGNLAENCCLRNCGSCFTYLRVLSLRRKPRLASSGEPINFKQKEQTHIMFHVHLITTNNVRIFPQKKMIHNNKILLTKKMAGYKNGDYKGE